MVMESAMVAIAVGEQGVPGATGLQTEGALVADRHVTALHVFVHTPQGNHSLPIGLAGR